MTDAVIGERAWAKLSANVRWRPLPSPRATPSLLALLTLVASLAGLGFLSGGYLLTRAAPVVFVLAGLVAVGVWLVREPRST